MKEEQKEGLEEEGSIIVGGERVRGGERPRQFDRSSILDPTTSPS